MTDCRHGWLQKQCLDENTIGKKCGMHVPNKPEINTQCVFPLPFLYTTQSLREIKKRIKVLASSVKKQAVYLQNL